MISNLSLDTANRFDNKGTGEIFDRALIAQNIILTPHQTALVKQLAAGNASTVRLGGGGNNLLTMATMATQEGFGPISVTLNQFGKEFARIVNGNEKPETKEFTDYMKEYAKNLISDAQYQPLFQERFQELQKLDPQKFTPTFHEIQDDYWARLTLEDIKDDDLTANHAALNFLTNEFQARGD
jgi:hypothetical protein